MKIMKNMKDFSLKRLAPSYENRYQYVLENLPKKGRGLDVGCKDFYFTHNLANKKRKIFGLDVQFRSSPPLGRGVLGDCRNIPFKDNVFDFLFCLEVLEHLKSDKKCLKEMWRVLRKGGIAIVSVPNKNFPFIYDPLNYFLKFLKKKVDFGIWKDHERLYDFSQLIKMCEKVGFWVEDVQFKTHYLASLFENYLPSLLKPHYQFKKTCILERLFKTLHGFIRFLVFCDGILFGKSKTSVSIMIKLRKL